MEKQSEQLRKMCSRWEIVATINLALLVASTDSTGEYELVASTDSTGEYELVRR